MPEPAISVIVATYNHAATLRYAIKSVLAQTFTDFELLVVGDACTDDSQSVVASFDDPRIRWDNLPSNSGSQTGPNNRGLELARGQYVAYLGHDDIWHTDHLGTLASVIEMHSAALVFSMTEELGPAAEPTGWLFGLAPAGWTAWSASPPPSSWLHRRSLIDEIGGWRDHRTIVLPVDVELLGRIIETGEPVVAVPELTVFKFTSGLKLYSYRDPQATDQEIWWNRLQHEPDPRYNELVKILLRLAARHPEISRRFTLPSRVSPGSIMEGYREHRGLTAMPVLSDAPWSNRPLHLDRITLGHLNNSTRDIVPQRYRAALKDPSRLPVDGIFIGFNWHNPEIDRAGRVWRWMDVDAQVVITSRGAQPRRLTIDLEPGPGLTVETSTLSITDLLGRVYFEVKVAGAGTYVLEFPGGGEGGVYALTTPDGGRLLPGEPRVLNYRVFNIDWAPVDADG